MADEDKTRVDCIAEIRGEVELKAGKGTAFLIKFKGIERI